MKKTVNGALFVHLGKDTTVEFDTNNNENLLTLRLKPNKLGEFIGNGVITEQNIFDREYIGIISRTNGKTYVRIDRDQTLKYEANKRPFNNQGFLFFIDQEKTARKDQIFNLFTKGKKKRG